ncbi:TPA: methyl-accepting chemotaxis protein [Aeromonas veronii]|uniref:methyl-accepting chemotaxis protein n=1 Tax=Aeromonas veronii TaxID=654 RepID=UPI00191FF917|nr:PAS domain-containing methyl-accepting chemotaxis protein [Aeromonas veronii]MBL0641849.1 PAS domain-containing methyl-accepting chemotaxis protein [Aeromonas veronii]MCJ8216951.1 PAS domain-containing methyl-accepting chemotaxis protein [Aeromonas veronii]
MFNFKLKAELQACQMQLAQAQAFIDAVKVGVATISFTPGGEILEANPLFLSVVGYSEQEVIGKHHRIFCDAHYAQSSSYAQFWEQLRQGHSHSGIYQRIDKHGRELWLEATYFPVKVEGKVVRVVKIASDITESYQQLSRQKAIISALDRALAIIEFTPKGEIVTANQNFLSCVGYSLSQLKGQHHRLFCDESFYREQPHFWDDLAHGQLKSGLFSRRDSHGNEIWLEATYNPIKDESGKVVKVIKFASEVTERIKRAQAVSEAANIAQTISQETTRFAETGSELLAASVAISSAISEQVSRTSGLIGQLNEQSKSIEAIVSTISSIAEQTNLLALNAAIEAARAGDQGRGFAVVADEVRQLAARTSLSTGEIASVVQKNRELTAQITGNINEVATSAQRGKEQIGEVSGVMSQIEQGAINVTETVSNLAIGS